MGLVGLKPRLPRIDWGNPITKKLVSCMPMFEGGGTNTQDLVSKRQGTIVAATWATDLLGNGIAYSNNGADHVSVSQNSNLLPITTTTAFTVVWWAKNPANMTNVYFFSEGRSSSASPVYGLHFHASSAGVLSLFTRNDSAGGGDAVGTIVVGVANTWQQYALTGNGPGTTTKLYSNGTYTGQSYTQTAGTTTFDQTTWGALGRTTFGGSMGGIMSNCMIFARVLTDGEIKQLYQNPWGIYVRPYLDKDTK